MTTSVYRGEVRRIEREFRVTTKPLRAKLDKQLGELSAAEKVLQRRARETLKREEEKAKYAYTVAGRLMRERLATVRSKYRTALREAASATSTSGSHAEAKYRQDADPAYKSRRRDRELASSAYSEAMRRIRLAEEAGGA